LLTALVNEPYHSLVVCAILTFLTPGRRSRILEGQFPFLAEAIEV